MEILADARTIELLFKLFLVIFFFFFFFFFFKLLFLSPSMTSKVMITIIKRVYILGHEYVLGPSRGSF